MTTIDSNMDNEVILSSQERNRFLEIDHVIESAIVEGNPRNALVYGRVLRRSTQLDHLMLAKLLYELHKRWSLFQTAGIEDKFEDVVTSELGVAPATVHKYITMWADIFGNDSIEDAVKQKLLNKPVRFLLRIGPAAREGDIQDWNDVLQASNTVEVGEVIKAVRGERTSSSSRVLISIDMRTGILYCKRANDEVRTQFGMLKLEGADETTRIAIERLLDGAGVIRN